MTANADVGCLKMEAKKRKATLALAGAASQEVRKREQRGAGHGAGNPWPGDWHEEMDVESEEEGGMVGLLTGQSVCEGRSEGGCSPLEEWLRGDCDVDFRTALGLLNVCNIVLPTWHGVKVELWHGDSNIVSYGGLDMVNIRVIEDEIMRRGFGVRATALEDLGAAPGKMVGWPKHLYADVEVMQWRVRRLAAFEDADGCLNYRGVSFAEKLSTGAGDRVDFVDANEMYEAREYLDTSVGNWANRSWFNVEAASWRKDVRRVISVAVAQVESGLLSVAGRQGE